MATPPTDGGRTPTVLKPGRILRFVQEGEETLWTRRDLAEDPEDGDGMLSVGDKIVRKGKIIKKVHSYFGNLESRKCCLRLAGCKTTFSNVRLVCSDGRDSGIEEGAMAKHSEEFREEVASLTDTEVRVLQRAYMCASYPVLCAPEPPSALTPSPVPVSKENERRFQFGGKLTVPRVPTPDVLQDSGIEEADDMSVIPAETLFELIRRAFRLSQTKFNQYESSIYFQHGKKDPSRILAEELVGQLAALENNSNPFYNPQSFMTPQGYDKWQRHEFSHIGELMKKFWHSAYPQQTTNFSKTLQSVHDDYTSLLQKLIRYEFPFRKEVEISASGPTSLLASASMRLLREFGLRYGIGEIYRKLVYLHYLTTHFEVSVWFIQHACTVLASFIDMLPKAGIKHVMAKREANLYEECLKGLENRAGSIIFRMKSIFPENRPVEGLESALELIRLTQEGRQLLDSGKPQTVQEFLFLHVQSIFPTCYNEHKMVAMKDLKPSNQQLTPTLLNMMIGKVRDEVKDYKTNYQSTFERYFNITDMAAKSLYSCLMDDVVRVFQVKQDVAPRPQEIDTLMLGLGYRLNQLDLVWSQFIPTDAQVWREWFQREQLHWSSVLKSEVQSFVLMSVSKDKFEMGDTYEIPSMLESQSSVASNHRYRSISTKSLTPSINSAFSGLMSSCHSTPVRQDCLAGSSSQHHAYPTIPEQNGQSSNKRTAEVKVPDLGHLPPHPVVPDRYRKGRMLGSDTQSLLDFEDDSMVTFANMRPCSSLPDILSKSYDHHLDISRKNSNLTQLIKEQSSSGTDSQNETQEGQLDKSNNRTVISSTSEQIRATKDGSPSKTVSEASKCDEGGSSMPESETGKKKSDDEVKEQHDSNSETDSDYMDTDFSFPHISEVPLPTEAGNEVDSSVQVLEQNAQRPLRTSDKDSLAEEFLESCESFHDAARHQDSESESESDNTDSPEANFDFPQVSEVAEMESHTFASIASNNVPEKPISEATLPNESKVNGKGESNVHVKAAEVNVRPVINEHIPKDENISSAGTDPVSAETEVPSSTSSGHRIPVTVPVSSSVIDLIVILQRIVGFGSTLCQTFYKERQQHHADFETSFSSNESSEENVTYRHVDTRRKLYENFLEGICSACTLHADNILCMDICGTTLSIAKRLAGPKMVEYLETQQKSNLVWGCRHDVKGISNCFEFVDKKTSLLCDRYEQVTEDMCTRINNVSIMICILEAYHGKLQQAFDIQDDWQLQSSTDSRDPHTYRDFEVVQQFHYNPDSDASAVMETGSQKVHSGARTQHQTDSWVQSPIKACYSHLMAVLRALSRTMAYRINLFVGDAMSILLALRESSTPVFTCLAPLTQFLKTYMDLLQNWLYNDNYRRVIECLWIFIVQDFESELVKLWTRDDPEDHAKILAQCLIHLLKFMDNQGRGIRQKLLLPEAEEVMFKLQIFSAPTNQLMCLHDKLNQVVYNSDTSSTCTTDSALLHVLHKMKEDLLIYRKCFSGKQLVSWIMHNPEPFTVLLDPSLSVENVRTQRDICVGIAQWLLDNELILDMNEDVQDDSDSEHNEEYPQMTITQATIHHNSDDTTPKATPRSTPVPKGVKTRSLLEPHRKGPIREQAFFHSMRTNSSQHSADRMLTPIHLVKDRLGKTLNPFTRSNTFEDSFPNGSQQSTQKRDTNVGDADSQTSSDTIECEDEHFHFMPISTPGLECYVHFEDSKDNFYCMSSLEESVVHSQSRRKPAWESHELNMLVEQAFEKKISPDFILGILYNRRKYDVEAREFFQKQPDKLYVMRRHADAAACEVS